MTHIAQRWRLLLLLALAWGLWSPALSTAQLGGRVATPRTTADVDAIHDNVPGEFVPIPDKPAPGPADLLLIEDSEAGYTKKRVTIGSLPGGGGGDVTTAVSLDTADYAGDTEFGMCTYTQSGLVFEAACDAAKTTLFTSDIMMFGEPMNLTTADGHICATWNNLTGRVTYHATGTCLRPTLSRPFDASAFNVGAGVTLEAMALSGEPDVPVLDGPDNVDTGIFALIIPVLWQDFAPGGLVTLQLACHSLSNQSGLTLVVRVGAAVCTAAGEALPAFVAPTSGTPLTCIFGPQAQDVQLSNTVTLTTTGCAAGERMRIPLVSEADMTATWSTTAGLITGGLLTYETVGTP